MEAAVPPLRLIWTASKSNNHTSQISLTLSHHHLPPQLSLSPHFTAPSLPLSLFRLVSYLSSPSRLATARFTICFYRPGSSSSSKMAAAELSSSCAQAAAAPSKVLGTKAPLTKRRQINDFFTCYVFPLKPLAHKPIFPPSAHYQDTSLRVAYCN